MSWWLAALLGAVILLIPTAYAGYIGAPYVPVRRPALKKAFDKLQIGPNDVIVDLGAGDGGVVIEAARRGAKAIGYELSPIMWAIANGRLFFSRTKNSPPLQRREAGLPDEALARSGGVLLRNFYNQKLPVETTHIFVFLMPQNLPRLMAYLKKQNLPHAKYLLSYTFALPAIPPLHIVQTPQYGTVYIYRFDL